MVSYRAVTVTTAASVQIHSCYFAEGGFFGGSEEDASELVLVAAQDAVAVQNGAVVEILATDQR